MKVIFISVLIILLVIPSFLNAKKKRQIVFRYSGIIITPTAILMCPYPSSELGAEVIIESDESGNFPEEVSEAMVEVMKK